MLEPTNTSLNSSGSGAASSKTPLVVALQQIQVLQGENALLTKQLCLKENYVQQKEQQLRVMTQRLDELESVVAMWREKYLQQLTLQQQVVAAPEDTASGQRTTRSVSAAAEWQMYDVLQASTVGGQDAEQIAASMEKLSTADREKLLQILAIKHTAQDASGTTSTPSLSSNANVNATLGIRDDGAAARAREEWEQTFVDVTEETQKVLLFYLLPVLQQSQKNGLSIHCFSRAYARPTMDFKVVCHAQLHARASAKTTPIEAPNPSPTSKNANGPGPNKGSPPLTLESTSPQATGPRGLAHLSSTTMTDTLSMTSASSATTYNMSGMGTMPTPSESDGTEEHQFDCVECDSGRAVPHGPRGLHPTKPVYISKPLPSTGSNSASLSQSQNSSSGGGGMRASYASANDPSSPSTTFNRDSVESNDPLSQSKDSRKMKKLMGSMFKGFKGHNKSPRATFSVRTESSVSLDEDEYSNCDGCGRSISGTKWVCRTCRVLREQDYQLCDKCYGQGMHGKENEDALFERIEEIVVAKCPKLMHEHDLMRLMRVGICKANLKKYSFCLTWISDLVQSKAIKDLRARALEISQITPQVRSEFVRLLRELLSKHRPDVEIITEWQPSTNATATMTDETGAGSPSLVQLDTLRIWVKDVNEA